MMLEELYSILKVYDPIEITIPDYRSGIYGIYRTFYDIPKDLDALDVITVESVSNIKTDREVLSHGLQIALREPFQTIYRSHPMYVCELQKHPQKGRVEYFLKVTERCDTDTKDYAEETGWISRQSTYEIGYGDGSILRVLSERNLDGRFLRHPFPSIKERGGILSTERDISEYIYNIVAHGKLIEFTADEKQTEIKFKIIKASDDRIIEIKDDEDSENVDELISILKECRKELDEIEEGS